MLRFQPDRAELELRDLAERVEGVVGQHVGGRLAEVERDEHAARLTRRRSPAPAAGSRRAATAPSPPARPSSPSAARSSGWTSTNGVGSQRVERVTAPGHRAGVPVFEHAAGVEHQRELRVRQVLRLRELRRHELPAAASASGNESPNSTSSPTYSESSQADLAVTPGSTDLLADTARASRRRRGSRRSARHSSASGARTRRRPARGDVVVHRVAERVESSQSTCQSSRASPGGGIAGRPICTRRSVLV